MDENLKYRRELIFKVLAWGTIVLLIVWGYSLTQSSLFELKGAENEEAALETELEIATAQLNNNAKEKVDAAQLRLENYRAKKVRDDSKWRAVGLIIGASIYCMIYPILVWLVYKRTDPGVGTTEKDIVPLRAALIYAMVMSLSTFITAFLTAWR